MNTINPEDARYLLENAQKGDEKILTSLAIAYYEGNGIKQSYAKAIECYKKAAELGYEVAQCDLAYMYKMGQGTPKDMKQAVYWYTKAAEQGFSDAQLELGVLYHNGTGVERDYEKSLYWYQQAAEQGNPQAQENLADMMMRGDGIIPDYPKAIEWFKKAAAKGMVNSQYTIGVIYVRGEWVEPDLIMAKYWLKKAADQGMDMAIGALKRLENMIASSANEEQIDEPEIPTDTMQQYLKVLVDAAENGDVDAQYSLACAYNDGDTATGEDYEKAYWYFHMAAEQGHMEAQCNLGVQYLYGYGLEQDFEQGIYWLKKAAEQGDDIAVGHLERLSEGDFDYYNREFSPAKDRLQMPDIEVDEEFDPEFDFDDEEYSDDEDDIEDDENDELDAYDFIQLGDEQFESGEFKFSKISYQLAMDKDPRYAFYCYYRIGWIEALTGNYEEALNCYNKGIALKDDYAYLYLNKGNLLKKHLGRKSEAEKCYRKCIELEESKIEEGICWHHACAELGLRDKAVEIMNCMLEVFPDEGGYYFDAACMYCTLNEYDQALEYLETSLNMGYSVQHVLFDPEIDAIRGTDKYKEIISKYTEE